MTDDQLAAQQTGRRESPCGWFEDGEHVLPMRVYYEDTDAGGIVYHSNYLKFAERARTEMMRCMGFEHQRSMVDTGVAFAVRRCEADYLLPARLDDAIAVRTRLDAVGGASVNATQRVVREDDTATPTELVTMKIRLACLDRSHRPARLPANVRSAMAALVAR